MTIEQIVDYVLKTPFNTNRAILTAMLQELEDGSGVVQLRRDNSYNYDKIADVFIPANGEICLVDTTKDGLRAKCGDGKTLWKDLEYIDDYVVKGYFKDGEFYRDHLYTKLVQGANQKIYIDLATRTIYFYDGEGFLSTRGEVYGQATEQKAGIMKLYQTTGENSDGAMSQKAITESQKALADSQSSIAESHKVLVESQKAIAKELDEKVEVALNMNEELLILHS